MAMGGVSHKGNGNGNRGRPYGVMLLLAFGAALLGVMVLHKLRERRIFNLLLEQKNRQLVSMQLLLQREREYTKELKRKAEETKAKIYSLRNQKMELYRRLLEMQSTIESLKDEQKTMGSALEEKENEIKLLQDKGMDSRNKNPEVVALAATLKQKEAEIEDLKHQLKSSVRVWSVSTDDPSNQPANITFTGSMEQKEKTEFSQEAGVRVHETTPYNVGDNSRKGQNGDEIKSNFLTEADNRGSVDDGSKKKGETNLRMDLAGGVESLGENARNEGATGEMKNEYSKNIGSSRMDGEKNQANANEKINDTDEQEQKSSFKLQNPHQEGESQTLQETHKGGKKLERDVNFRMSRMPGRVGHLSRTKGKRWRILAKNRFLKNDNSEVDGIGGMRSRRFSRESKDVRSREEGAVSDEEKAEREATETGAKHQNSEDTEDMKQRIMSAETNHQVEGENAISRNPDNFLAREVPVNTGVYGEARNYKHDTKLFKVRKASNHFKQNLNSREFIEVEKKAELNSSVKHETEEDIEVADKHKPETEASNSEDIEGYKEETDDSEF